MATMTAAGEACADCTHPRAYHTGGQACRSSGCLCERWQVKAYVTSTVDIPDLVMPVPDTVFTLGLPELRFRGERFDIPTMGEWRLSMSQDGVAELTLTIPVRVIQAEAAE